jgi:cytochrome c-type biogenesis protein CcmF
VALKALGLDIWASGLCFALCAYVCGTIVQEFWRGTRVRSKNSGSDLFTALVGLVGRNKRRYGGYIVHLGIVAMCFGFAGSAYKLDEQVLLKQGQTTDVGKYTFRNDGIKVFDDGQKQMTTAYVAVIKNGKQIDTLYPARWVFHRHEESPTTEVGIRRGFAEDVYLVLPTTDPALMAAQTAVLQIVINPLVNWIWLGFGIMAVGTMIALLPERAYSFATSRSVQEAAATTAALVLVLALSSRPVFAQAKPHIESPENAPKATTSELEKEMRREMVCICDTCPHYPLSECTCSEAAQMRAELSVQVAQGKDKDQLREWVVQRYGSQEPLGAPIDRGFNRLAWLFPFAVGGGAVAMVAMVAVKWSRRKASDGADALPQIDPSVSERLDDELRDLD